jgi:phosphate/phosphite/phosphonate ABC transporter binding protein
VKKSWISARAEGGEMRKSLELKILVLMGFLLISGVLIAGYMVMTIERTSLYDITETSSEFTAAIISRNIERTMMEGRADITKKLISDLKGASGIEEISVLHYSGRPAFEEGAAVEKEVMTKIAETGAPIHVRDKEKLTFYKPLKNSGQCMSCHSGDPAVLGAVKTTISIASEYDKATNLITFVIAATVLACLLFSFILWMMIRRMVITPIKSLGKAAAGLSEGDLSFGAEMKGNDEIALLGGTIRDSLFSISGILRRVKEVSGRVIRVAEDVDGESGKVVEGAGLETEAVNNISASMEEMKAVIAEIAGGTDGLAASAEETAASMEQMVTSISQITGSTQDLSEAVEATSSSIEELSATIGEVSNNANELEVAAGDTQGAIIEISSSIKEVEQRAKESSALSEKVKKDAVSLGMVSIEKTIDGMRNIQLSVEKTANYITRLGGRSEEIGQILTVIDEITDQTTLLALNAAILAAQAGEHGKGFSVVADEIKDLADRTSKSTQEIEALIQSVQVEVGGAVEAMQEGLRSVETGFKVTNEAADALRKIVESSRKSSEMAFAIERSTTEQSGAVRLVSEAMEKVLGMVGQIAKATTEQNRGIQHIIKATEKINDVTKHLRSATAEQSQNSKQVSKAMEFVSDSSQQISRAINEQKIGSNQIWDSLDKIKDLPRTNRDRAFRLNQLVKELLKDSELAITEMEKFTFPEDVSAELLRMGIVPLETPAVMFKKFSPLAEYLRRKLSKRIDLKVAIDFKEAVEDIGKGSVLISFMTPSTYIEANKRFGVQVMVKALRDGKPFQHSVIVARSGNGIKTVEDVKGRSFAFGDFHSTSSHIVPRAMLLDSGIDLKDLAYYNYLGHHDDVAKAVMEGEFDAGGLMETTAVKFRDRGLDLIKFSEEIPEFNICVAGDLDEKVVSRLREAFISISDGTPEGSSILKSINQNYTGFVEAADEDYAGVRVMMSKMGLI